MSAYIGTARKFAFANVAASSTDTSLVSAVAGKKIRVLNATVSCGATASSVTFNSKPAGAGSAISATFNNSVALSDGDGYFETNVGEGLSVTTGAGSTTGIQVAYTLVTP
jgi:hypothetical protein